MTSRQSKISETLHGTSLVIDGIGIFLQGASGSGKTSLALGLMDVALARGIDAKFISDDQTNFNTNSERLIASAPDTISGKAELAGFGIIQVNENTLIGSHEISLVCTLSADNLLERMPERETIKLMEIELDHCPLPARHEAQAVRIIMAAVQEWF